MDNVIKRATLKKSNERTDDGRIGFTHKIETSGWGCEHFESRALAIVRCEDLKTRGYIITYFA
jgi:hypothetical protein